MIKDVKATELAIRQECDEMRRELATLEQQASAIDRRRQALLSQLNKWESQVEADPPAKSKRKC